jgi:hypothetical protein
VRPRRWSHWLGLVSLPVLYIGGFVVSVGLWWTFRIAPSNSARYGLCVAPLLALALVASVRGRWAVNGLWIFAVALFGLTVFYSVPT